MKLLERFAVFACHTLGVTPARLDEIRSQRDTAFQRVLAERASFERALQYRLRYGWPSG